MAIYILRLLLVIHYMMSIREEYLEKNYSVIRNNKVHRLQLQKQLPGHISTSENQNKKFNTEMHMS